MTSREKIEENVSLNDPTQVRAEKTQAADRAAIRPPGLGLAFVRGELCVGLGKKGLNEVLGDRSYRQVWPLTHPLNPVSLSLM